jgi:superfamily II DNA/RNA helicase
VTAVAAAAPPPVAAAVARGLVAPSGGQFAEVPGLQSVVAAESTLLVAHEDAVRGLDLPDVQLVLMTMLPDSPEEYIHLAGRTGRRGRLGDAVSVLTKRELNEAGLLTRALGVPWRMSKYIDMEFHAWRPPGTQANGEDGEADDEEIRVDFSQLLDENRRRATRGAEAVLRHEDDGTPGHATCMRGP